MSRDEILPSRAIAANGQTGHYYGATEQVMYCTGYILCIDLLWIKGFLVHLDIYSGKVNEFDVV